ncbi:MAG: response regulator [Chitinophagaceae bacterium]|nr:MAG: response regulator [Chitinophagaceae bacterium]
MNEYYIYAVDDDPIYHTLVKNALKNDTYKIECFLTGDEAIENLNVSTNEVSAIILDYEMPGRDGISILKWIKKQKKFRHVPVILLTSNKDKENIRNGISAGAYYYLTKPFKKSVLMSLVRSALNDFKYKDLYVKESKNQPNPFIEYESGIISIKKVSEVPLVTSWLADASKNPNETMTVSELIMNGIEHGNLNISYDEKTMLIDEERLYSEIERRSQLPENRDKHVELKFNKGSDQLHVTIKDQGDGFNFEKYLFFDENRIFDNHGRGIAIVNSFLDIRYLGNGSEVIVKFDIKDTNAALSKKETFLKAS